ncbi:MAG: thiamine-phosphate kinase [Gemmatimonadales bacterium]|nr:MAG: thiamine-phosphate kinase [Gemmatimonadales bacterium]
MHRTQGAPCPAKARTCPGFPESSWISGPPGEAPVPMTVGRGTPLGPGAEFDRIRGFLDGLSEAPGVRVGPGDDGAVLEDGTVLSSDLSIEGTHFRLDWVSPEEAGYRATAAALSDLAAMAARPLGVLVSVAVPAPGTLSAPIMAGVRAAAAAAGAPLLGGDLTRSPGPAVVDVMVVGRADPPLLRSGARPGDELWVTGTLGAAAAALEAWGAGRTPDPRARYAFCRPVPRIEEARWLVREAGARAGLDLSDGIAGDAAHLAAASGVGIELDAEALLQVAHRLPGETGDAALGAALRRALHGGEDFELLVVLPPGEGEARVEEFRRRFDLPLSPVGQVGVGHGVRLRPRGGAPPQPLSAGGWDHFATGQGGSELP